MESHKEKLLEFKTLLIGGSKSDIIPTLESLDIRQFLDSINGSEPADREFFVEVLNVVRLVLDSLPSNYILTNLRPQLEGALSSRHHELKDVWLRSLNNCLRTASDVRAFVDSDLANSLTVTNALIDIVGQESESNYKFASKIIKKCSELPQFHDILFSSDAEIKWSRVKDKGITEKMRVFELMTELACLSDTLLSLVDKSSHLKELMQHVQGDDVLVQLNALQLICSLSATDSGVQYLHRNGHLNWLLTNIFTSEPESFGSNFLTSAIITIFGNVGRINPMLIESDYKGLIEKLLLLCKDDNFVVTVIAVLSNIAKSHKGKRVLGETNSLLPVCMSRIASIIENDINGKRVEIIYCLDGMLQPSDETNEEEEHLTEEWFRYLDKDRKTTKLLIDFSQRPFPDVRIAALKLIHTLTCHMWGQKALSEQPEFLKSLLDRSKGMDKEGKEGRYQIVEQLCISPFTPKFFKSEDILLLRKFYKEGPFHIERETMVSFESQ